MSEEALAEIDDLVRDARRRLGLVRCAYCTRLITESGEDRWADDDGETLCLRHERHLPYREDAWYAGQRYRQQWRARR